MRAAGLLDGFDDRDLVAGAVGLGRIAKSFADKLSEAGAREAATARQQELARQLHESLASGGLRAPVVALAEETVRVATKFWPDQPQRLHFYETMGRATFDAGEPNSDVRPRYFGGQPAGD